MRVLLLVIAMFALPAGAQLMNFTAWWGCSCGPSHRYNKPWGSNILNFAGNECDSGWNFDVNNGNVFHYKIDRIDFDYLKNQSYLLHTTNTANSKKTEFRMVRSAKGRMGEGCYTLEKKSLVNFDWDPKKLALSTCSFHVHRAHRH
eukprot:TRINITY_DN80728_c0_g1_i1.p1 TRINITY_DN80728_c0_g1~~TRINITY_DN80728_c0_g1_i1.p1  ORF type:complete len:159 (-),score=7.21 TRINITY_DN80728_c0_g1_i1:138-575(-)